jgi:hypothetical protein
LFEALPKKCVGPTKERGQAHLPNPETISLPEGFYVESLSGADQNLKSDQLEVRKEGLPPLFLAMPKTAI